MVRGVALRIRVAANRGGGLVVRGVALRIRVAANRGVGWWCGLVITFFV